MDNMDYEMYNCPLLKREIDEDYCVEINYVRIKIIKVDALEDKIDRAEADVVCEACPHLPI